MTRGELEFTADDFVLIPGTGGGIELMDIAEDIARRANELLRERLECLEELAPKVIRIDGVSPWFDFDRLPAFTGRITHSGRVLFIEERKRK